MRFIVNRSLLRQDGYCSFQSLLFPSYYLRLKNFTLTLEVYEDSLNYKTDASWKMNFGFLNDGKIMTVSLEPLSFPGMFLNLDGLSVKKPGVDVSSEEMSFFLEEVRPAFSRRKRRNVDEL